MCVDGCRKRRLNQCYKNKPNKPVGLLVLFVWVSCVYVARFLTKHTAAEARSAYLHDLQQSVSDDLQRLQRHSLLLRRRVGERTVAGSITGPECAHGGRLHLADAKQLVELGQRELRQT